jgi:hypothetical protein
LYAQTPPPPSYVPTDGLQLWFSFNDSLQPYDVDPNDVTLYEGGNVTHAMDRVGNETGAGIFDGQPTTAIFADVDIIANDLFVAGDGAISINFWYSANIFEEQGTLAECYQYGVPFGGWQITWQKLPNGSAEIVALYENNNSGSCSASVVIPEYDFSWHMVTVVYSGVGATIYIDGNEAANGAWTDTPTFIDNVFNFNGLLRLGNWGNGTSNESVAYKGRMDEFGLWSRQLTQEEITNLGSVPAIAGCLNSNACNYNADFLIDDENCSFECLGCTDPYSCNFDQNATISAIDSCEYNCIIDTIYLCAFLDLNQNGIYDESETALQNWPIEFSGPDSAMVLTNEDGYFMLPVAPGQYNFEFITSANGAADWINPLISPNTPAIQSLLFPSNTDTLYFSFAPDPVIAASATASVVEGFSVSYNCQTGYTSGLFIQNTGSEVLNGVITLDCDLGFTPGPDSSETIGPDLIAPGHCEWYVEDFMPGSERVFAFHVLADTSEIEDYSFNFTIDLVDGASNTALNEVILNTIEVDCDELGDGVITADPEGFFEPHFVLPGEPVLYRVAFQNNTIDTIQRADVSINFNSQRFDLNTVDILYVSQYYVGCLHDDGTLALSIDRSEIPPSSVDSVGSVVFMLVAATLRGDLQPGDLIDVDPIVLLDGDSISIERYRHTIFDCESFTGPEYFTEGNPIYSNGVLTQTVFQDDSTNFSLDLATANPYADSYLWILNGDTLSSESSIDLETFGNDEISDLSQLELEIGNSLCSEVFQFDLSIGLEDIDENATINVYPNPFNETCTFLLPQRHLDVVMYDGLGRPVRQWVNCADSLRIDREDLKPGCYHMVAQNGNQAYSVSVIIE